MAKSSPAFPKTDVRYWQSTVFQPEYTWKGESRRVTEWAARMQHLGRRELMPLGTANKTAAATRAKEIYLFLQANGWEPTLQKFKPDQQIKNQTACTVGEFLAEVKAKAGGRPKTIGDYCRAFRTIVAGICGIDGGREKFDYCNGGQQRWLAKVEGVKLSEITPEKVQAWKIAFLRRAGSDPVKQRSARISCNSLMRQAKSLFAPGVLKFVQLEKPEKLPFTGVKFEPRQSMRYRSSFDVQQVIKDAQAELPKEQLKIFLLAVLAGLRRNEIDKLEWAAFRWNEGVIRIEATPYFHPKSEDSIGDVNVDPELLKKFWVYQKAATGNFVIESSIAPRPEATYTHYRCAKDFCLLMGWLRSKAVTGNNPLHTLRKEFGSQICAKHGIYAASHALRHGDIAITSQHYLDQKRPVTVGMGHLLTGLK